MNIRHVPTIVLLCCASLLQLGAQEDWTLAKQQKGVSVYTRSVPDFPIKEYKAEVLVDAPLDEVVDFFNQVEQQTQWMEGVVKARRKPPPDARLYYEMDLPFPFKDRFMWLQEAVKKGVDHYMIVITDAQGPAMDGLVGLSSVRGSWTFESKPGNSTLVRQQFLTDPGGAMPDWLVNLFIVKNPYKTMKNLRDQITARAAR